MRRTAEQASTVCGWKQYNLGIIYKPVKASEGDAPWIKSKTPIVNNCTEPEPVYEPFIMRNNRLHSGCIFWQPANSEGVIQPSAEWGRLWL